MLLMVWPPWNSVGSRNWLRNWKIHIRSIHLRYQQYLILKRHFLNFINNTTGITIFILCCICGCLPRIEADRRIWQAVIDDLQQIKDICESIDASLYTENTIKPECEAQVMTCFSLELHVILHECKFKNGYKIKEIEKHVENVEKNVRSDLQNKLNMKPGKCKKCEEYEEKSVNEFIKTFEEFATHKIKYKVHIPK